MFKPFEELTPADIQQSVASKLQGQVNLALIGQHFLNEGGSITLTSGIIKDEFIPMGTPSALVNGGLEAFVASATFEIGHGVRINAVSPNALVGSWETFADSFKGFIPVGDAPFCSVSKSSLWDHDWQNLHRLLRKAKVGKTAKSKLTWRFCSAEKVASS